MLNNKPNKDSKRKSNRSRHNKGDIINIAKAAARKSISMQITARAKSGKWIPLSIDTGQSHQCQ
jgi:hypothetical protein